MVRRVVRWGLVAFAMLAVVCVARGVMISAPRFDEGAALSLPAVDEAAAVERFSKAVRIPTISINGEHGDPASFRALHALLRESFPRVYDQLDVRTINEHSLLFRWEGSDPERLPILLLAHMDVVPVEPGTEGDWAQPPFSGAVVDGEIWGRGTMDDKAAVMAILEAVDALLASGHQPQRTIMLAFGHDEEIGGRDGAQSIAKYLTEQGLRFEMILDEGGAVIRDTIPGLEPPAALIGIAEKGYASLELTVTGQGGHSSMPAAGGTIARLARAVRMVDDHQMGARLDGPSRAMLEQLAPHMSFPMRLGLANLWLLKRVFIGVMLSNPSSAASVRTTTAPTIITAGTAENVMPQQGRAVVNFRIVPGDTVESVITHVRAVIGDPSVDVHCLDNCWDPSPPSRIDTPAFATLKRAILHIFPDAAVAPFLVVGATDAHHYQHLSESTYRFLPQVWEQSEASRLHGTGERIPVQEYTQAIRFYLEVLLRSGDLE